MKHTITKLILAFALLAGFSFSLSARDIPGHQFVFFNEVLTQDQTGIPPLTRLGPADLSSPTDYTKGRLYLRIEILEKPSDLPVRFAYFIWQRHAGGFGHVGVSRKNIPDYTDEGVYYLDGGTLDKWWRGKYAFPDWTKPFDKMALVPWVGGGHEQLYSVNCHNHCFQGEDISKHVPIVYRATGVWVAPGKKLVPPADWECPSDWDVAPCEPSDC